MVPPAALFSIKMFAQNVSLAQFTNYKIGGPAKFFVEVKTIEELTQALTEARRLNEKIFVLGGGNNLLISDSGFDGVVIRIAIGGITKQADNTVAVGAGVWIKDFLDFCLKNSLSGWEWAGGLPSTMGGAIWGNAGAFGGETKDRVISVTSVTTDGQVKVRTKQECAFGYRNSFFKENPGEIIVSAQFQLEPGNVATSSTVIGAHVQYRTDRHPLMYGNCGSVFKNVPVERVSPEVLKQFEGKIKHDPFPVIPTALLVLAAGLPEYRVGDAMVSPKHSNFIVNLGKATAADVKAVMAHVKKTIKEKFGIELEQEVIFVG